MKLKPIWSKEEDHNDKVGTSLIGKIVYCHSPRPLESLSYCLSTAHIIGWVAARHNKQKDYYTFTSLADGMTVFHSLDSLIDYLNAQPYVPIPSTVLQAIMGEKVQPV